MDVQFDLNWEMKRKDIFRFYYVVYRLNDEYVETSTFLASPKWDEEVARKYIGITDSSIKIIRVIEITYNEYLKMNSGNYNKEYKNK